MTDPNRGKPVVAIDVDGVVRALVPHWMVGEPALAPVPPMPDRMQPGSPNSLWYDRDAWRARFAAERGRSAAAQLDKLLPVTLDVNWRDWPNNIRHQAWVKSFGTDNPAEATVDMVPFVRDYATWSFRPEPADVRADPAELDARGQRWWAPETATMDVLLVPWVGRWIRKLLDRGVSVVWSTTWGWAANAWISPALGLPPLDWAQADLSPGMTEETLSWKIRAAAQRYPNRPIAMLDDHLWWHAGEDALGLTVGNRHRGKPIPSLLVTVDEVIGVTRGQARQVENWLGRLG